MTFGQPLKWVPEACAEVVRLREQEHLKFKEIGERYNVGPAMARVIYVREYTRQGRKAPTEAGRHVRFTPPKGVDQFGDKRHIGRRFYEIVSTARAKCTRCGEKSPTVSFMLVKKSRDNALQIADQLEQLGWSIDVVKHKAYCEVCKRIGRV